MGRGRFSGQLNNITYNHFNLNPEINLIFTAVPNLMKCTMIYPDCKFLVISTLELLIRI